MSNNRFGFDFLRNEHNLPNDRNNEEDEDSDDDDKLVSLSSKHKPPPSSVPDASRKSDLEKQADVLVFLRAHRSSGCLPPSVIFKSLGIDLSDGGADDNVAKMLGDNPKVNREEVPDPENPSLSILHFGYRAKFSTVRDKATLLAQINRCKNGVKWSDLADAYDDVERDLKKLLTGGEVLGVANSEVKDRILFPRGEPFLVELDGCVTVNLLEIPEENDESKGGNDDTDDVIARSMKAAKLASLKRERRKSSHLLKIGGALAAQCDPRLQIRRGEAIRVGGKWFRVSSSVREDLPLDKQPPRAQAPPSVVSVKDLSKKNDVDGYVRRFDKATIPLDGPLTEEGGIDILTRANEARERLHRIAGGGGDGGGGMRGVAGGVVATLLSPFASEKNQASLAGAFAKGIAASFGRGNLGGGGGGRKRPTAKTTNRRSGGAEHGLLGEAGSSGAKGAAVLGIDALKRAVEDARLAASDVALSHSHPVRHGVTKDVREMYLETLASVPDTEADLHKMLLDQKLIEPGEKMSRPRMKRKANVDNDGKPKKRRYYERKNMRMTNTHLEGTDIGKMLARAADRQSQGMSVGDGGM